MSSIEPRQRVVTIVVNPRSGRGRAGRLLPRVVAALDEAMPDAVVRVIRTRDYADARERTVGVVASAAPPAPGSQPDVLVMMGGDGMASLGLNACAGSHVQLGIIPAGTGDDFARGVGIPRRPLAAAAAIAAGRTRRIDLTLARGAIAGGGDRRYIGSVVSSGYDARVNYRVNHARLNLGSASYASVVLSEIAHLVPLDYRLVVDGTVREEPAVLVAIGNAGYIGGGVHICPDADPADGLLDVTLIKPVSRMTLVRLFPQLYRGDFVHHPAIERFRAREVVLDGDGLIPMADGEELGQAPLRLTCEPGVLEVLVGDGA
ncbi:YegS/Rv2252/BmrU family lipid kinase [Brooklawnia cerclae]|uniref:Diacylglycerol kinase (ATP) n=1 Tax=Brooklawnia cerclae TaxID=349934 RepID=A0ABX0SFC0_9ACTN|nr:diacylglycerol kinase family protein [Brooklawnia cerclae]NIH57054.1 diacylglycerol kinase (ATP) [Brooklawnia cerclae]